ncbi:MAG: PEFG-CTERM sorting domain-containing protein [Nitrosopumilus sp.]|nr:PEFG-CTERM sorting domain-containing protein [Nitrosopumilus sp.]
MFKLTSSRHIVEITDTSAIPEFQTIAMMILISVDC